MRPAGRAASPRAVAGTSSAAQEAIADGTGELTLNRVQNRVEAAEALGQAKAALNGESLEERLAALDKREQVERLLAGMKAKK